MNKLKRSFALGVIFWGTTNLSQISLAQYWVPIQPPVPRHDTMFPRRDRSNNNIPSSSPTSRFTPEEVREIANNFKNNLSSSPLPYRQMQMKLICSAHGDPLLKSRGLNSNEIAIFKDELGC